MLYTKRTIEKKQGKKWIIDDVSTNFEHVSIMLIDELTGKFLYKNDIKSIHYQYGKIIVKYGSDLRVIYE